MRARLLLVVAVASLLAACSSSAAPGWTYAPAPSATPIPSPAGSPETSGAPSGSAEAPSGSAPAGSGSPAATELPSGSPAGSGGGATLAVSAQNVSFDVKELQAAANQPFQIAFTNKDAGIPHNIAIQKDGNVLFAGDKLNDDGSITYNVPALPAGTYQFICQVHPIPAMTGTLTVQ